APRGTEITASRNPATSSGTSGGALASAASFAPVSLSPASAELAASVVVSAGVAPDPAPDSALTRPPLEQAKAAIVAPITGTTTAALAIPRRPAHGSTPKA